MTPPPAGVAADVGVADRGDRGERTPRRELADRYDCPACRGTWIRILTHDRTGIALRCVRCGCRFSLGAPDDGPRPGSRR